MMIQYFNKIEGLLFQSEKTWHYHTSLRKHSKKKFYVKTHCAEGDYCIKSTRTSMWLKNILKVLFIEQELLLYLMTYRMEEL